MQLAMNLTNPAQFLKFDRKGGAKPVDVQEFERARKAGEDLYWIHLDYSVKATRSWLKRVDWLEPVIKTNLLDDDTRPRSFTFQDGVFLSLRGVNLNPGAEPEDMIAVRLWADEHCVITSNRRKLLSIEDVQKALDNGSGPHSAAAFISFLIEQLATRAETVVDKIEDDFDETEDQLIASDDTQFRTPLASLRRQAIRLRRFFAPQREALEHLINDSPKWLSKQDKLHLRESSNKFNRYLEELDSIRDRAIIAQEELLSRFSETLNRRMYTLSLVATLFLPLGFLTGLLGINVGGIPGADSPYGFLISCTGILIVVGCMLALLKAKKWF